MLNWELMKNPLNWIIVTLMILIGVFFWSELRKLIAQKATASSDAS